ncbi:MAG: hypothetical protein PHE26_11180, partial [Syntrophomonadaceae bacterium]|nr:hypothetical protein [Syntrophomonadaceae bacterium]
GFLWQYSSEKFNCDSNVCVMIAFNSNLLSEEVMESELRIIFCEGKKISSIFETPIQIEIWHDDAHIHDEYLELLLTKMLGMQYSILYSEETIDFEAASYLFNQISAVEKTVPGGFLKYCFIRRYSLKEYFDFINIFRQFNRIDLIIKGLELLTASRSELLTNINENIKELIWSNRLIYTETAHFIGSAFFNIAVYELNNSNRQKAKVNAESCLEFIPNQKEAKNILAKIR